MRLKSYLRGIGIGILVTAAVFIVSGSGKKETMTDAQIIARAKELGMVEASTTLVEPTHIVAQSEITDDSASKQQDSKEEVKPTEEVKEETKPTEEVKDEAKPTEEIKEEAKPTEEVKDEAKPTEEVKKEAKPTEEVKEETKPTEKVKEEVKPTEATKPTETAKEDAKNAEDYIVIVVNSGDGSGTVSRKLFEAGIIDDAAAYDRYLMTNGYDRTITVGNHKISINASNEEIAKNLTSKVK